MPDITDGREVYPDLPDEPVANVDDPTDWDQEVTDADHSAE